MYARAYVSEARIFISAALVPARRHQSASALDFKALYIKIVC
jgi:hypothetical protein